MNLVLAVFAIVIPISALALPPGLVTDRDLSGRSSRPLTAVPQDLIPDHVEASNDPSALTIQLIRMDHNQPTPVTGLVFASQSARGQSFAKTDFRGLAGFAAACASPFATTTLVAPLQDDRLAVTSDGRNIYRIVAQVPCHGLVKIYFDQSSNGGQALGIWQVASHAKTKLEGEIGLQFWTRPLVFQWPADGDYYDGSVHLTRGDFWDVVGHEMGHGIYDFGELGVFGGGDHKIDQCYSDALALSEGWASYFSAWVSLDLRDPDAKFEYMVPRRAPLRIETIPSDVCRGPKNEWRVIGFFWDLIDLHDDGETAQVPFRSMWQLMYHQRFQNMDQIRAKMLQAKFDPTLLNTVWNLNF